MTDAGKPMAAEKAPSLWHDVWLQFRKHKGAMLATWVLAALILFSVLGPLVWRIDPNAIPSEAIDVIRGKNQGPSWAHPMGTDQLARDQMARMMAGGRVSISVGLVAMIVAILVGGLVGVLSGYFRKLDGMLMRLTDLFLALPLLPLLLLMMFLFGNAAQKMLGVRLGIFMLIVLAIGLTSWMQAARIVRGEVLALKEREFILAARSIGTPSRRIITRHILPNVLGPVMVSATLCVALAIITESVLSFLGVGFPSDFPTWGRLLNDAYGEMQIYPLRVFWPGLAISLTVLSVNYIGDGLRDALDPRIRGR
jgi:peptide/nickel transport system permease protein